MNENITVETSVFSNLARYSQQQTQERFRVQIQNNMEVAETEEQVLQLPNIQSIPNMERLGQPPLQPAPEIDINFSIDEIRRVEEEMRKQQNDLQAHLQATRE